MMKRNGLCIMLTIVSATLFTQPAYAQNLQTKIQRLLASDKVEFRDLDTGSVAKHIWVSKAWNLLQMEFVPDINGNGAPELVVPGQRDDGVSRAIIKDSKTGEFISSIGF